nr:reverse transcriptase domain-containing protein [Tanacetum cinerariifolium]
MESVFRISNCSVENQIKFSTCTLLGSALTWWNFHVTTVGPDAAYAMTWVDMKKKITDKYYPRGEMKKLEKAYKIKRYVGGLSDVIHGSVVASRPKTMQEAIKMENEVIDKRNNSWAERQAENQRKVDDTFRSNQSQQQQLNKRQNTGRLKNNNNHGNQGRRGNAPTKVYAVGHAGIDPDSNVMMGTFLLNNRYASVLFVIGADKSFVSTAFSSQINITPSTLDHCYDVELADERIIGLNPILRGCTLNLLNHPFNINLFSVELGSFDAIIGMDWLAKYQAVIACAEKIFRIPWGNKTLIIHGDGSYQGNATQLNIIPCTKTEKYMMKGFPNFLAHVTTKKVKDKSEKKRLEDVQIVQNFPEVFLEDFLGLPLTRPVEF